MTGSNKYMAEKSKTNQETGISFNMPSAPGFWKSSIFYYSDAFCLLPQLEYRFPPMVNANVVLNPNEHAGI